MIFEPNNNEYKGYKGNPLIKRSGVQIQWTPEMEEEWFRCAKDPIYFIKKYIKVIHVDRGLVPLELYDYQEEIIETTVKNRHTIICTARQAGKTTAIVGFAIWYVLFNEDKALGILANKASTAREILNRIQLAYTYIPKWLQVGAIEWNKSTVSFENRCRILAEATSSSSVRGWSFSCVEKSTEVTAKDKITGFINNISIDELAYHIEKRKTMYGYVYLTVNKINNKKYIGASKEGKSFYLGSGKLLLQAVKKYGKENFEQHILEYASTREEMFLIEKNLIDQYNAVASDEYYNLIPGGSTPCFSGKENGFYGKTHTDEVKERIRISNKKRIHTEAQKLSRSKKLRDLWDTEEFKQKWKENWKPRNWTEEQKQEASNKRKGTKLSEEVKIVLSEKAIERWQTADKREKYIEAFNSRDNSWWNTEKGLIEKEKRKQRRIEYNKSKEKSELNTKNQTGKLFSDERKHNISMSLQGRKLTESHKNKLKEKSKNSFFYNNGLKSIKIKDGNPIPEGFERGRLKKK